MYKRKTFDMSAIFDGQTPSVSHYWLELQTESNEKC